MSANVLYPTVPAPAAPLPPIRSHPFWPEVAPDRIRGDMNIGDTISPNQLNHAVIEAIALSNQLLKKWRVRHQANGYHHLADIEPDEQINHESVLVLRYLRAIACFSKALTLEKYLDYDSTAKAETLAQAKQVQVDIYWRDGHAAISDLLGLNRMQSELI